MVQLGCGQILIGPDRVAAAQSGFSMRLRFRLDSGQAQMGAGDG